MIEGNMAISYFEKQRVFLLQGKNSTYAISIAKDNGVQHNHWGGKLLDVRDVPATSGLGGVRSFSDDFQEYRAWGGHSKITPCLKLIYPDGARAARGFSTFRTRWRVTRFPLP